MTTATDERVLSRANASRFRPPAAPHRADRPRSWELLPGPLSQWTAEPVGGLDSFGNEDYKKPSNRSALTHL